jgi:dienelactone hydrolase
MKPITLLLGLCLSLLVFRSAAADPTTPAAPVPSTPAAPPDPYQTALPGYQYVKTAPLDVKAIKTETYPECRMLRFTYASTNKQRVPALFFTPKGASKAHPLPCLVILHGLGASKEAMAGFARYAATQGYASLAIDEYAQGERALPGAKGLALSAAVLQSLLLTGVPQTVVDVRRGLDYLETCPGVDHKRTGLVGVSLGAIIGTVTAGVDTRLKATVLISGGGDWAVILKYLAAQTRTVGGQQIAGSQDVNWAFVSALLVPEDPITFAPHIAPRAVLMLNGRKDTVIVPQAAEELYKAVQSGPGARAQITWFPDSGHIPSTDLIYPVVKKWLAVNL